METLPEILHDTGHDATFAHYHGTMFKTNATVVEIREMTTVLGPEA